ncbi:MAG: hypothetical protein HY791_26700 [Deltaproteobacteria bacterium]|nr:hypothetical protein [Deltaproteobacteria bacterium]
MRRKLLPSLLLLAACSKDNDRQDAGPGQTDTGTPADGGPVGSDGGVPDSGPPPCARDQDCESGEVCDLSASPHVCVPGHACTTDLDCRACSDFVDPIECGHGFHVVAYCDADRGSVCTRALTACEPCAEDRDCFELDDINQHASPQKKCLEYEGGKKFCGLPQLGNPPCPAGFLPDTQGQCKRVAGCPDSVDICPAAPSGGDPLCPRQEQICPGRYGGPECPTGGRCATNDIPGEIGVCLEFCTTNDECRDPAKPVCDLQKNVCVEGCQKGSCAGGKVCHPLDGKCKDPCDTNENCAMRYGSGAYCNMASQRMAPTYFKDYHDEFACVPVGCEASVDCQVAGFVCDKEQDPPACVEGCYDAATDCLSGEVCKKVGPNGRQPSYSRSECRGLGDLTEASEVGVCCNPGCTNRILQCGYHEWCCGQAGSPYADPTSCGNVSGGARQAEPGECFPIAQPAPFCVRCEDGETTCDSSPSGWTYGRNSSPMYENGMPFREEEGCFPIEVDMQGNVLKAMCGVTCNPDPAAGDTGCPRQWPCKGQFYPCFEDADCGGLVCEGEDPQNGRPGKCECGANGVPGPTACPTQQLIGTQNGMPVYAPVLRPRCAVDGPKMNCLSSYNCEPPAFGLGQGYPMECTQ